VNKFHFDMLDDCVVVHQHFYIKIPENWSVLMIDDHLQVVLRVVLMAVK